MRIFAFIFAAMILAAPVQAQDSNQVEEKVQRDIDQAAQVLGTMMDVLRKHAPGIIRQLQEMGKEMEQKTKPAPEPVDKGTQI